MNGDLLTALPRLNNGWEGSKDTRLCNNVELAEALPAPSVIRKRRKFVSVCLADRTDVGNPSLQGIAYGRPESNLYSTAAIVTAHDDVRDMEHVYGVLQDGQAILIIPPYYIANVAVDKKFTGGETDNFVCRDAAVSATDPQVRWRLDRAETLKELGIAAGLLQSPGLVVGKKLRQKAHD